MDRAAQSLKPFRLYLAVGLGAVFLYRFLPEGMGQSIMYELIGISAAAAVIIGTRVHRPDDARAWTYIAIGLAFFVLGDIMWAVYQYSFHIFPEGSIADLFYLAGYPFLALGVWSMVRARTGGNDRGALVDAGIFAAGMGIVVWELTIRFGAPAESVSLFGHIASFTYPLADLLVVAMILRLVFVPGARVPSSWLLLAGLILTLVGDDLFAIFQFGHVLDPLWLGGYVLIGAAALHPSMKRLTKPAERRHTALGLMRFVLLGVVLAITMVVFDLDTVGAAPQLIMTIGFAAMVVTRMGFIGAGVDRMWKRERQAQSDLSDAETTFRSLVERLPAVTYTEEPDLSSPFGYRDTYVSPQVQDILGISVEEWMTNPEMWRSTVHPDDRERIFEATNFDTAWDRPYKLTYRVIPRPGEVRWVREEGNPVHDTEGRRITWQGMIHDISDEKAAEEETVRREAAEKSNEAKSRFLSRASHELRTPLNAILGFGQLLEMDELKEPQRDSVEQIVKSGRHLLALVNDILEINEESLPEETPFLGTVDLDELLGMIEAAAADDLREAGAELTRDPTSLIRAFVVANERLQEVISNLVSNAIKYGGLAPMITLGVHDLGEDIVRISVSDGGPGLSRDQLDRLWTPFDRLDAESRGIDGTGLGLTLVRTLVEGMNGSVSAESTAGIGTTFNVDLPGRGRESVVASTAVVAEIGVNGA